MSGKSDSKKVSISGLKKKADKSFSTYIRYRDGELRADGWYSVCITCGVWRPLKIMQNGHFVGRTASITRFDERNCNAQCYACNIMKHGDLYNYSLKLDEKYGVGTAEELHLLGNQTHKFTIGELEEIIHDAQERVNWYVNN